MYKLYKMVETSLRWVPVICTLSRRGTGRLFVVGDGMRIGLVNGCVDCSIVRT